jgi:hypothetical protein
MGAVGDEVRRALDPLAEQAVKRDGRFYRDQMTRELCHGSSFFTLPLVIRDS